MLGNDVIDLNQAKIESNWNRRGYLDKIFSESEKELIFSARDCDTMVWLLWSMKEAAYKIVNRQLGKRFYSPQSFLCGFQQLSDEQAVGTVQFNDEQFFTQSSISDSSIHTIALSEDTWFEKVKVHHLVNEQHYLDVFNDHADGYQLQKTELGVPYLMNEPEGIPQPASISHHGQYLAIVHFSSGQKIHQLASHS